MDLWYVRERRASQRKNGFGLPIFGNLAHCKFLSACAPLAFSPSISHISRMFQVEARFSDQAIYGYKPKEAATSSVAVKSVFPHRGGQAGGSTLTVYGKNLKKGGANPIVTVGGSNCAVQSANNDKLQCNLPGGSGTVDVVVNVNGESSTFKSGYRYITGY